MNKAYEPQKYEDAIYKRWEESGFFNPDVCIAKGICAKDAEHFSVVLPPPNITDKLHLGHVVMVAITDILARYHRMNGKRVLWIPGTDHAALATQNVVEKRLLKEKKITRHDLGRKKFIKEVENFVNETQATIINQLHKTGASLDWSRLAFTLDEARQKAVKQMFVDMYNEGVIYRGYRMVNWCPRCQSTLSDDEVEHKEQQAKFYTFKYSQDFPFGISTTRPETKLGDTGVAVNPKDKRYKKYIDQVFEVDFCGVPLTLKIIVDENVDMDFGTGALGITPAHSFVDYEMAQKNKLAVKKIINETGEMLDVGKYSGLSVSEAREAVVNELDKRGLLEKVEETTNNLSVCERCGTPIEPLPSKQWFVAVDKKLKRLGNKSLKEKALEVGKEEKIKFTPERFKKRYLDWMENLHDWCISRQIWYGHQIPVYYCKQENPKSKILNPKCSEPIVSIEKITECPYCKGEVEQEEDVLDTWFSSGMWTFSTMGWPDLNAPDLKNYQPTQILETGYEIITLWVSRMIMMSLFALNEIPFENVYLHGMILDKNGKKMSKSKGNGIDPLEMISKYGTDATRLSLIVGNTPGNDSRMSEEKIADYRNFANKLWNIARFILSIIASPEQSEGRGNPLEVSEKVGIASSPVAPRNDKLTVADKWILEKLNVVIKSTTENIEQFNFSQAGELLRDFTWGELADWYLEIAKIEVRDTDTRINTDVADNADNKIEILNYILNTLLKLWHPFMPFVTEQIWNEIMEHGTWNMDQDLLMVQQWPSVIARSHSDEAISDDFELIKDIITGIRSLRAEQKIEPAKKLNAVISAGKQEKLLQENSAVIKGLARLENLQINKSTNKPVNSVSFVIGAVEVFVDLAGVVDLEKEKTRLNKEKQELEKFLKGLEAKLGNKDFVGNAPSAVVEKEREKLTEAKNKLEKLINQLEGLK